MGGGGEKAACHLKARKDLAVTAFGCNSYPTETQSGTCSARTADNTA